MVCFVTIALIIYRSSLLFKSGFLFSVLFVISYYIFVMFQGFMVGRDGLLRGCCGSFGMVVRGGNKEGWHVCASLIPSSSVIVILFEVLYFQGIDHL